MGRSSALDFGYVCTIGFIEMREPYSAAIDSFESLYRKLYRRLCIYALHYVGDVRNAEDIVQECFLSYWSRLSGQGGLPGGGVDAPGAFLFRSVRNRSIDFLRSGENAGRKLSPEDCDSDISDDEAVQRSGVEAALWTAIDRLPDKRRRILLMSKRDRMSYQEIAHELGISVFTVRNQISRALSELRSDTGLSTGALLMMIF